MPKIPQYLFPLIFSEHEKLDHLKSTHAANSSLRMNTVSSLLVILGSLGVFLFGMKVMSEAIQKIAGKRLRALMRTMTQNRFLGVFTGLLVTMLIQSSSATTVMVVSFVNAQLLTLVESIGIIMGANLGTTGTFWLVSTLGFKFSLSKIALPIIGIGLPMIFFKKTHIRDFGEFLIGFGILFLGLSFLKDAVPDIKTHPEILSFIQNYTGHGIFSVLFFFVVGTILAIIVQSSSVAGAITITMAYKGWIDFPSAAAIIPEKTLEQPSPQIWPPLGQAQQPSVQLALTSFLTL